ncbi:hypothetical protein CH286_26395 [Rhodococcus sp. WWJCD1]|uniref:DUF5994 family protein n=1 Tax=Rhodococcus sp. WWJCD1 TaxID=2022519 RepID=UPI000B9C67A1|nr:DUF5994 family protein [Rhodococcus sp. WWJCD1]OZC41524.1 hypothetical protein CH286_26395 [Rhodococcus sp. WWJCD1]
MTNGTPSGNDRADYSLPSDSDRRLTLTAPDSSVGSSGEVDGAWLSFSDDLDYEAPDLVAALTERLGPIDRVLYRLDEWQKAPRRVTVGARSIHLDGYRFQPHHTLGVRTRDGDNVTLLVIPPLMSAPAAQVVLRSAGERGNTETVQQLLGLTLVDPATDRS